MPGHSAIRRLEARRLGSAALIVGGALLLVASATSMARAAIARDAARSRWAEIQAERVVAGARDAARRSTWVTAPGTPVARLTIPRLGLDEVVIEGLDDEELRAGPGHMPGSALPGDSGTSVMSAHRDRHFHPLGKLVAGDTIFTESLAGKVTWTVTRIRVVDANARALRSTEAPMLTLTTCWPIRYLGPAPKRLIVDAEPIVGGNWGRGTGN